MKLKIELYFEFYLMGDLIFNCLELLTRYNMIFFSYVTVPVDNFYIRTISDVKCIYLQMHCMQKFPAFLRMLCTVSEISSVTSSYLTQEYLNQF